LEGRKSLNYKNISKFAGSTMISRILGYFRDMMIANFFGAGFFADAFYVAYRVPNLFRRLLGEGALISAFVPIYTDYIAHKTEEEQQKFLDSVLTVLSILLILITILGIIFTPFILKMISPGFINQPEKFRLTVLLSRIMFPFFIGIGISAFFMGILFVYQNFLHSALSSCFLSIADLIAMFFICPFVSTKTAVIVLSVAVVVGGAWQTYYQCIPIIKQKMKFSFNFDLKNEGLKKVAILMLPATFSTAVEQVNSFIDVIFASCLQEGSVSALYYANRLMLLPLSLFGIAVSSVSLPSISKSVILKDFDTVKKTLCENINIMFYFIIPSTVGLIILANPIVKLLFERGKFDSLATSMSTSTLQFYCVGLFSYSLVKIVVTVFYALKDTKTPVKIASVCVLANIIGSYLLMKILKVGGLALSTSLSSILNLSLLLYFVRKRIGAIGFRARILKNLIKILISSLFMGIACFFLYKIFKNNKLLAAIFPIFIGGSIYISLTYLFKVQEIMFIANSIKNKFLKK
jgi:putative peptidoglycan lipid II flippase